MPRGGTDTFVITLEWTLAKLIYHPNIKVKAEEALDQVVGRNSRMLE
jgi:hypothetical protein